MILQALPLFLALIYLCKGELAIRNPSYKATSSAALYDAFLTWYTVTVVPCINEPTQS